MVRITRAHVSSAKKLGRSKLSETGKNIETVVLDVTAKSGTGIGKVFAPTWAMVKGVKSGAKPIADYSTCYRGIYLAARESGAVRQLFDLIENCDELILLCYCSEGYFCHTLLLKEWLIKDFSKF